MEVAADLRGESRLPELLQRVARVERAWRPSGRAARAQEDGAMSDAHPPSRSSIRARGSPPACGSRLQRDRPSDLESGVEIGHHAVSRAAWRSGRA